MAELRVPDLGESIVEATVGTWLKQVGDHVAPGEAVAELETDKVNVEVMAEDEGIIGQIVHEAGDTVTPGDVIGYVTAGAPSETGATASPSAETTKAQAPFGSGENVPVSTASTGETKTPASSKDTAGQAESGEVSSIPASNGNMPPRATPAVRRLAVERGVPLSEIAGSGGQGRITSQDIASPNQRGGQGEKPQSSASSTQSAASSLEEQGLEEHVRLSRRRLTIAKRLVEAQHTAAMLTTFNEIDMSAVMEVRKRRKESFRERHGVGLGFMSFFTKAVVGALKAVPRLNAEIRGEEMILKHYYDIGIAVATEGGLVVPVVRDADSLSFADIEKQIASLAKRARDNQLSLQDLNGGTFTITNGGTFGSLLSTPILNPPQVGILGMHKIEERPVGVNGKIELRPMMYVALSYDHRIVDGSEAVRFLVRVKELLEDPEQLWLEG